MIHCAGKKFLPSAMELRQHTMSITKSPDLSVTWMIGGTAVLCLNGRWRNLRLNVVWPFRWIIFFILIKASAYFSFLFSFSLVQLSTWPVRMHEYPLFSTPVVSGTACISQRVFLFIKRHLDMCFLFHHGIGTECWCEFLIVGVYRLQRDNIPSKIAASCLRWQRWTVLGILLFQWKMDLLKEVWKSFVNCRYRCISRVLLFNKIIVPENKSFFSLESKFIQ